MQMLQSVLVCLHSVRKIQCFPPLSPGSAADVCELLKGDEIVSINGAEVGGHYQESVMHVINNAAKLGQLELKIRRNINTGTNSQYFERFVHECLLSPCIKDVYCTTQG